MENKIPMTKRGEKYLARIEELEKQFADFVKNSAEERKELELYFSQRFAEQREEIVRLRKDVVRERKDSRARYARARTKLKSE